jgi:hypothetical protein
MNFYEEMAGVANDLLTEFNQATAYLIREAKGTGPAYNPGQSVPTILRHKGVTVRGISQKYIDGKDIIATDLQASLSVAQVTVPDGQAVAVSVRPTVKDTLEISGVKYRIIRDLTVPAVGTAVAYLLAIRKF